MSDRGAVHLYLSENRSGTIRVYRIDAAGVPHCVQTVEVGGNVMPMAVSPDRRRLFAAVRSQPMAIVCFAIDAVCGRLSELGRVPAPESTVYLSCDHGGRHLLGACNPPGRPPTGLVTVYPVDDLGIARPPAILRSPQKLHALVADPTDRFLIAPCCDGDLLMRYRLDAATGEVSVDGLAPVHVLPGAGPRHLRFHPSGRFLYLVNEYDGSVVVFRWDTARGKLHEIQTASAVPPGPSVENWRAADLHFTPDGRWLYLSVRSRPSLTAFRVDPLTGMIAAVGSTPAADEPRSICIEPSGRWLYAVGLNENRLLAYGIDSDSGVLQCIGDYPTGDGPNWIECLRLP